MRALGRTAIATMLATVVATPAGADVKAGVDAWTRGEYRKAIDEWRGPAVAGDADAQFNLGQAYKLGRGVPVDIAMAEEWYRKAAQQGHVQAEDNYGLALFQNNKRDQALPWLEKSVARGEPRAQYLLGTMLFNGDAVKRDWVRAYALMTRASAANLAQATQALAQMDQHVGLAERQRGTTLARQYEAQAQRVQLPSDFSQATARVETAPRRIVADPPRLTAAADPLPRTRPIAVRSPQPPVAARGGGAWRAQLGAFRDPGGARRLWSQLGGRFPGSQPYFVKSGALTRLLVGPFASPVEATRACAAVRPCVPTRG